MKIKSYYTDCRKETEGICFTEPSMTQQHFKDECDMDKILRKYETTGFLVDPLEPRRQAQFGDFLKFRISSLLRIRSLRSLSILILCQLISVCSLAIAFPSSSRM